MAKMKKTKAKTKSVKSRVKKAGTKRKSGLSQLTYTVSDELEEIIGAKKATRPQIVKKLWVFIKAHKLQDTKNKRMICPNDKLASVFGSKKPVDMLKMAGLLNKHIKK